MMSMKLGNQQYLFPPFLSTLKNWHQKTKLSLSSDYYDGTLAVKWNYLIFCSKFPNCKPKSIS